MTTLLLTTAALTLIAMSLLWLLSLRLQDASIVDIYWGLGFVLIAWAAFALSDGYRPRKLLLCALVTVWGVRLALHHRIGRLEIGEASVAIAAASPHRGDAYAACRYAIERVKQIAPIWKREFFEGGDVWIEGATADPDDRAARAEAERVACA